MLALAYDAALRREELCSLRTDDLDPAHRMLRVRAETTKTRRERMVPYSAPTGVLLSEYLRHRAAHQPGPGAAVLVGVAAQPGQPLTLWTWSKVVRRVALAAEVPRFSTHTTRHLCLTDLARMGWELHAIATFAGHRSTDSTLPLHPPVRAGTGREAGQRHVADPRVAGEMLACAADRRGAA